MKYVPPYGSTDQNARYYNGTLTTKGSIIPAGAVEGPMREVVNAISLLGYTPSESDLAQLGKAILTHSMQWSNTIDYTYARPVIGSDNLLYLWKKASGPSTTPVDPTTDTTEEYWLKYNPSPEIPTTSSTNAGLVKLSDALDDLTSDVNSETAATPYTVGILYQRLLQEEIVIAGLQRLLIRNSDNITNYQLSNIGKFEEIAQDIAEIRSAINLPDSSDSE